MPHGEMDLGTYGFEQNGNATEGDLDPVMMLMDLVKAQRAYAWAEARLEFSNLEWELYNILEALRIEALRHAGYGAIGMSRG